MSGKIDFKKHHKTLFAPRRAPQIVDVPNLQYLMIEGRGSPESETFHDAINALYSTSYSLKFMLKSAGRTDFVVPPLEALWWSADPSAFELNRRDEWQWTIMIMQPDEVTATDFADAIESLASKGRATPAHDRTALANLDEGRCVQVLHVGPYGSQGSTIQSLHAFAEAGGYEPIGKHHEIYLSDPRRTAPERLKTLLRRPVAEAAR